MIVEETSLVDRKRETERDRESRRDSRNSRRGEQLWLWMSVRFGETLSPAMATGTKMTSCCLVICVLARICVLCRSVVCSSAGDLFLPPTNPAFVSREAFPWLDCEKVMDFFRGDVSDFGLFLE